MKQKGTSLRTLYDILYTWLEAKPQLKIEWQGEQFFKTLADRKNHILLIGQNPTKFCAFACRVDQPYAFFRKKYARVEFEKNPMASNGGIFATGVEN